MSYDLGFDEVKFYTRLNDKPIEYDFKLSKSRGGYKQMPTLKEIFDHYPAAKISLKGVENLKNKLVGDRPMTYDDIKNVKKLADRFPGFFTKEE